SYAAELLGVFDEQNTYTSKDLEKGQYLSISKFIPLRNGIVSVELFGGINVNVDLNREKRFLQLFGHNTTEEFETYINDKSNQEEFLAQGLKAYVVEGGHNPRISLMQGYSSKVKEEMMQQIKHPKRAYVAKIVSANRGGYFVDILGVNAFMPGSLAAANKIIDFRSMVGKEVIVMVEDFINADDSFIVSHKKYIEYVLPMKIKALDLETMYEGTVTGTSKYGVFIEFGEMFTGLLHVSKMTEQTKAKYESRSYKPGDKFEFYIDEITKDNRIILSEESPEEKRQKMIAYAETIKDKLLEVKYINTLINGILVSDGDNTGIIPSKEIKKYKLTTKNLIKGDILTVMFSCIEDNKILFKLPNKKD
ncbi:MAG: S1 RNA-binding domain-containing protein, partial [Clostridia bacterium]